ncbi:nitroreductase family protein [Bacillus horti]|uniref:SagB-type dehydrogenase family enzyme n=1 Tax=Caldalkalibacillus horti TaxID=77523 RepID=A0ABT9W502_9BACI|nr:nitroreductase family protein [Bacillus horti]MDQ0167925.1 SagB-type dehydrogenase family enzyme [Bacillus horti]
MSDPVLPKQTGPIYERVSCRSFENREIPEAIVHEIITAGTYAPASGNMQPWEFIIVDEIETKKQVAEQTFAGFYSKGAKSQQWVKDAGIIIIACVNYKRTIARYGELGYAWAPIDTTSAVQNMILAATERGIASCWVGGFKEEGIRELMHVPSYVKPIGLIPMEYPAIKTEQKQKLGAKWVTHKNTYNIPYFN